MRLAQVRRSPRARRRQSSDPARARIGRRKLLLIGAHGEGEARPHRRAGDIHAAIIEQIRAFLAQAAK